MRLPPQPQPHRELPGAEQRRLASAEQEQREDRSFGIETCRTRTTHLVKNGAHAVGALSDIRRERRRQIPDAGENRMAVRQSSRLSDKRHPSGLIPRDVEALAELSACRGVVQRKTAVG